MDKLTATVQIESGLTPYETAISLMRARIASIHEGTQGEFLWFVEHPPLYTAGTSAAESGLKDPARFPTYNAGRGGQWTYHGPGQRVVYAMLNLNEPHGGIPARDIRGYVGGLECWVIETLKDFGIKGETRQGRVGIWVVNGAAEEKIGAIGVRVSRWVSWHGLALNVNPDLSHFTGIVPCGITEHGVTSLAALGVQATMSEVDAALLKNFTKVFGA
ncbi:lipoyl(octanoyl) transferase LipB [Acidocella sp.]|uniref:lipoyl(octanoyl) transferase LipB n=1 Tax=Acidocella sp. TaxID=50710 RepID=UPI0026181E10|nr:lipoyl(octanoyl) transferase LipB [Acidocella sp.]MDD2796078.1 lipoyl(octanoyl) transferase LipB [Acidocella sp.]